MRKQLYLDITAVLKKILDESGNRRIQHIDLWNRNVEFIETDGIFQMPAVFFEFHPIDWSKSPGGRQEAQVKISLHVVTKALAKTSDGSGSLEQSLAFFELLDDINRNISQYRGTNYGLLCRVQSLTNHDHNDILESVETYEVHVVDKSAATS